MKKIQLILVLLAFSLTISSAQKNTEKEEKSTKISVKINEGENPILYIDGKKQDYYLLELLDQDKIMSVEIFKSEEATDEYPAGQDVVRVLTKGSKSFKFNTSEEEDYKIKIKTKKKNKKKGDQEPVIVLDGKVVKKGTLDRLDPDNIKTVEVMKGDEAVKKYKAPNGVIIVTTKGN